MAETTTETKKKGGFWDTGFTRSVIKSEHVTTAEKLIGYLVGPFGGLLCYGIFTSWLSTYFTDVLGLETSFLSQLQLWSTILIVAANLVVGQLLERTHTLAGKARPWILLSALTMSVSCLFMFIVPFEDETAKMVWIAIAYNLFYAVAFPIYNTANSTLCSASTRDSGERGACATMTNIASLGTQGAGSMIFPLLVSNVIHYEQSMWLAVMVGVGIFACLTIYLQFRFTRERVTEEDMALGIDVEAEEAAKRPTASFGQQFKACATDKYWWIIIIFYLVFQFAGAIKNGSMSYYAHWVLGSDADGLDYGTKQTILSVCGAVPMAVAMLFVSQLCRKFTKRWVVFYGMVIGVIGGVIALVAGDNFILIAVGIAIKCFGSSPSCYQILAMLADEIDHIEFKTGVRCDSFTMSIYSSLMVAASPVMTAVFMAMLDSVDYDATLEAQSEACISTITTAYITIETVAYAICAVLIFLWMVEKHLPEEQAAIAERKAAAKQAA